MIFRRTEPRDGPLVRVAPYNVGPAYHCASCDVGGIGSRCWCCGGNVTPVKSLWNLGSRGPIPVLP